MSRAGRFAGGLALVVGATAVAPLVTNSGATESEDEPTQDSATAETELATVVRGDLVEEAEANGTVGFGETSTLPIDSDGMVTQSRESGEIVRPGEVLLRVAERPIYLVEGNQPLYRELRRVSAGERDAAGDKIGLQTGADVEQLQQFLVDAGFDDKGRLEVDGSFGLSTERAVKEWQRSVGLVATGKIDRTQMVFVDGPVRIESAPGVGENFDSVSVTSGAQRVSFTVTSRQKSFFEIGASVTVEAANSSATGTVTKQKRVVGDDGSTQYEIEVEIDAGQDLGDAEAVKVKATRTKASDVLTVPVRALIALAEGGWAVQVQTSNGIELTGVELGDVVDGQAQISGVDEGASVVVPV